MTDIQSRFIQELCIFLFSADMYLRTSATSKSGILQVSRFIPIVYIHITHPLSQSVTQSETSIGDSSEIHTALATHIGVFVLSCAETLGKYPLQL